jgi:hypothetical protein
MMAFMKRQHLHLSSFDTERGYQDVQREHDHIQGSASWYGEDDDVPTTLKELPNEVSGLYTFRDDYPLEASRESPQTTPQRHSASELRCPGYEEMTEGEARQIAFGEIEQDSRQNFDPKLKKFQHSHIPCRYTSRANCKNGDRCWYKHTEQESSEDHMQRISQETHTRSNPGYEHLLRKSPAALESTMEKGQRINPKKMKRHYMSTPCKYGSKADCKRGAKCLFMHADFETGTFQIELEAHPVETELDSHQFLHKKTLDERYTMGTQREMQQLDQQLILSRSVNVFPPGAKATDF